MARKVIIDYRTSAEAVNELNILGFEAVRTIPVRALYEEVRGHADMQIHFTGSRLICAPEVCRYYKTQLHDTEIISGSRSIGSEYPYDIAYNTCAMGKYAICRREYTAPEILSSYKDREILDTRQGYAKCSICIVNSETAITSDSGLYSLMASKGLNVLKISPYDIELYGMSGFIGGASGLLYDNLLAFNGDLSTHRDHKNIEDFCRNVGVDTVSLSHGILKDIGSIISL